MTNADFVKGSHTTHDWFKLAQIHRITRIQVNIDILHRLTRDLVSLNLIIVIVF